MREWAFRLAAALVLAVHWPVGAAAEGDAARGERAFQRCYACHSVDPAETAALPGPSLAGVVGRRAAALAGFEYSDAMQAKGAAAAILIVT